jgi:hypothetical protein
MADGITFAPRKGSPPAPEGAVPKSRSKDRAKDVGDLPALVAEALRVHQDRLGLAPGRRLTVRAAWPKDLQASKDERLDTVAMRVVSRMPANMSCDRVRRQYGNRVMGVHDHPDDPNLAVTVLMKPFDNVVEFRVMSTDASDADNWVDLFQRFMDAWNFYFIESGIVKVAFLERGPDSVEWYDAASVYVRPLRYFVKTQQITQTTTRKIDSIRCEVATV